jgi:hypothetical protein
MTKPMPRPDAPTDPESRRLAEDASREKNWKRWGPYLSERQWGTVREDYSPDGSCWTYFPHEHARSRTYRWGEDGLLGITDRECRLCFALALWNEKDPILKERLFGLTNPQGNHGEDVKECYYFLDSTPTHSYMKAQYKYPQAEFPYQRLLDENKRRTAQDREFELADAGVFDDNRYFDVIVEYAKGGPDDILVRINIHNRGPERARLHLLPTLWFRNTWCWGATKEDFPGRPTMQAIDKATIVAGHPTLGNMRLHTEAASTGAVPELIFTENETNIERIFGAKNISPWVKDAFHDYVIHGLRDSINVKKAGTKAAAHYQLELDAGGSATIHLRLGAEDQLPAEPLDAGFGRVFDQRKNEAEEFFASRTPKGLSPTQQSVMRQSFAGLLWSKQFYHYVVEDWLNGDPLQPPPPESRKLPGARNVDWPQLYNRDVISMPDTWEYPWYAAWDLAFHMLPFARIDPEFAKAQLLLFLREWYMHPNGQIPAYEFALGDVNPPVHAWACWRVYKMSGPRGKRDRQFLARCFQKLLINFTWWVNRKDPDGKHLFSGGFLGLDNIGVFDRSRPLPAGGHLEQADGTAWMAFYCGTMLAIAVELASEDSAYDDVASKFFEHFVAIADAINTLGGTGLWDEADGFYYDQLHIDHTNIPLKVRSMVGLIPLLATLTIDHEVLERLPGFAKRMDWFLKHRGDLARHISYMDTCESQGGHKISRRHLLAIPSRQRLECVLRYMLDENEFLSPFGIRSLSKVHGEHPYVIRTDGQEYRVDYEPGESTSGIFGGNSNWRGPVWFPVNYLLIESLERYHYFYGDDFKMECPTGSGRMMNLEQIARELRTRLTRLFVPDAGGRRPCHGDEPRYATDPNWKDLVLFHEYFHAETGRGLGASHQTGWTALVTMCMEDLVKTVDESEAGALLTGWKGGQDQGKPRAAASKK